MIFFLTSPLEQFLTIPFFTIAYQSPFSFINGHFYEIFLFFCLIIILCFTFITSLKLKFVLPLQTTNATQTLFILNNTQQTGYIGNPFIVLGNQIFGNLVQSLSSMIDLQFRYLFPYIFSIYFFILSANLIGFLPATFTITSHLSVTFFLAILLFILIYAVMVTVLRQTFLSFFLPAGMSFGLSILLVPLEIISFFFRPISLAVRLFANIMAGHALFKIIIGFVYQMIATALPIMNIIQLLPIFILVLLFFLEIGVAFIQAYVFSVLTCLYLSDTVTSH